MAPSLVRICVVGCQWRFFFLIKEHRRAVWRGLRKKDEGGGTGRREGKGRVIGLRDRAAMVGHGVSTHSCSGVGYV